MSGTILYADDEPRYRDLVRRVLEHDRYEVLTAEDGPGVLAALEVRPDIDLVLLDILMPGLDGWEVCRRLKGDERTEAIPVIFVTAMGTAPAETRGLDAGAVDYIAKPFSISSVRARVRAHLGTKGRMDRLAALSQIDALTGADNRRAFDAALEREWDRVGRTGERLGLVMVDVDSFKVFNDRHGHVAGDACLRAVAGALRGALRRPADRVARYGGEEFALLLPGVDVDGALIVAERGRAAVSGLGLAHGGSPAASCVTISAGAAAAGHDEIAGAAELVRRADVQLYAAKASGRNTVCP